MFQNISWQSYWLTMSLLTTGYYLVVYLLYFRSDFKVWLPAGNQPPTGRSSANLYPLKGEENNPPGSEQPTLFDAGLLSEFQQPPQGSEEHLAYRCMDELNAFFEQARASRWTKESLIRSLKTILEKYSSLYSSVYRDSLHSVLITQCQQFCSIHLSAEEAERVWLDE